jgi:predicted RNase H-like HicB family nuclease
VRWLRSHAEQPLATLALTAKGKKVFALTDDPAKLVEATADGQVVLAISVESLARHLERSVTKISAPLEVTVRVHGRAYRVILTPDLAVGGYTVEVPALPGCLTEGDTLAEAKRMARDAIGLWLDVGPSHKAHRRAVAR